MLFGQNSDPRPNSEREAAFAEELEALREIIEMRENKEHGVKLIITAIADGAKVNALMNSHMDKITAQIVDLVQRYGFDGVDIDWEYPSSDTDWKNFDLFFAKLDGALQAVNENAIISAALSTWALGMRKETLDRIDQIQYMAYDGNDKDGYQSSLHQAQEGLAAFLKSGADIKKVNIGIAAYGRPLNGAPYWADWKKVEGQNIYWESRQYNVETMGQLFDATFCSPALAGDKAAYALLSGAGGVMVFRLGCDKTMDNPNAVAKGIENALKRHLVKW